MKSKFVAGDLVKHLKSGNIYRVLHYAVFALNGRPYYVYSGDDGIIRARAAEEMENGLFERADIQGDRYV